MNAGSHDSASFERLGLPPELLKVMDDLGYASPRPIQVEAVPVLMSGRDVIGQSPTGSGKTAAFALPILARLRLEPRQLQAIILCPTRELCAQVAREFRKLGRGLPGLQVRLLCGGAPLRPQADALERGVHIAVGTPGRVVDHLSRATLDLGKVKMVVLDEADRMLDMGFSEEMDRVLGALPEQRQSAFFSATFPESIEALSRAHQKNAFRIELADIGASEPQIRQLAITLDPHGRLDPLLHILGSYPYESALVFCNMKVTVAQVMRHLQEAGVSAGSLHGDLEQFERDRMMARFRNGSVRVLVATDVAARGIDIAELELVINFDLPPQAEVYVHRIGRTGRTDRQGLSISLISPRQRSKLEAIEAFAGTTIERVKAPVDDERGRGDRIRQLRRPASMSTIQISGGRKDKLRPGDILGALTGEAGGLEGEQVGKIEIHERTAFVAVAATAVDRAIESLRAGKIKGRRFRVERLG